MTEEVLTANAPIAGLEGIARDTVRDRPAVTAEVFLLQERLERLLAGLAEDGTLRGLMMLLARGTRAAYEGDIEGAELSPIFERTDTPQACGFGQVDLCGKLFITNAAVGLQRLEDQLVKTVQLHGRILLYNDD